MKTVAQHEILSLPAAITPDELAILALVAVGLENPYIAEQLAISRRDVPGLLRSVFEKLGARERTHAVARALQFSVLLLGKNETLLEDPTPARVLKDWNDFPTNAKRPTEREVEVLTLLAQGASRQTIMRQLQIQKAALEAIMHGIFSKTFARDRTHAMVIAMRLGWLSI